jgi:NADPH-dependent ferric siderophore reductase
MYGVVQEVEQLTPGMVRVVLGEGELGRFEPTPFTDEYVNAQFVPLGAPYGVPFGPDDLDDLAPELRPKPRRYTVRAWDPERQRLTIDFVTHGDEGYAGPWAARAQPGDRLQLKGPGGSYAPDEAAAWHLLIGDESALPAIAASLEAVEAGARVVVRIVVDGPEHEHDLASQGQLDLGWLHRRGCDDPAALLPRAVAALDFGPGPVDLFVHGEAGETRDVRRHLMVDREMDLDGASISPYWRRHHTDEAWRAVKGQWLAEQSADA